MTKCSLINMNNTLINVLGVINWQSLKLKLKNYFQYLHIYSLTCCNYFLVSSFAHLCD